MPYPGMAGLDFRERTWPNPGLGSEFREGTGQNPGLAGLEKGAV